MRQYQGATERTGVERVLGAVVKHRETQVRHDRQLYEFRLEQAYPKLTPDEHPR